MGGDVLLEQAVGLTATGDEVSATVRLLVLFTAMSFIPALLLVMTPFTRFIVVFSLLRQALGLQQSPPNQVLIGLSLFLSLLVMGPTLTQSWEQGIQPFMAGEMETLDAIDGAMQPMRGFMMANVQRDDMRTVLEIGKLEVETVEEIPTAALTSAYVLSELRAAFVIAIKVYIPFLVIDLVVGSVLLGMGMMMLPPPVIAMPFKLLIFVLMDGWGLLVTNMVQSFNAPL
ncbi:MAG: flagellar type III secretion system pore protein FliP [Myxococcota bacterium]|nr:flagellar type III secretion system pore protein FliP [Myxococcota bacterium]